MILMIYCVRVASSSKGKGKASAGPVTIDENTVYLEDIDSSVPKTPARKEEVPGSLPSSSSPTKKKNRWHDHDPYRLPDVDLEARVSSATRSSAPDPRLATEEELRNFIEEMRPEDFDVSSPAFRELPTEVQYEIIGDLRLKSRQTSYKRLQNMLKKSRTALDFSKEQIKNLKQRNSLTQQLLVTTDTIGQAHVSIPIRVASERNREYVLIKNEGKEGGWVLGIREEGSSKAKPIEIDQEDVKARAREKTENVGGAVEDEDSDMDMEEVDMYVSTSELYSLYSTAMAMTVLKRPLWILTYGTTDGEWLSPPSLAAPAHTPVQKFRLSASHRQNSKILQRRNKELSLDHDPCLNLKTTNFHASRLQQETKTTMSC